MENGEHEIDQTGPAPPPPPRAGGSDLHHALKSATANVHARLHEHACLASATTTLVDSRPGSDTLSGKFIGAGRYSSCNKIVAIATGMGSTNVGAKA